MALTSSNMLPLGTPAPEFTLPDAVTGNDVQLSTLAEGSSAVLVMFICNHCPYVVHVREELGRLAHDYQPKGVAIVAINSNSIKTHPQDGPTHMKTLADAEGWRFPFAFDASQDVARAYGAACTPDFFVFDHKRELAYRGQLDDSRPRSGDPVTGKDLRAALDALLAGEPVSADQTPSMGCGIRWER